MYEFRTAPHGQKQANWVSYSPVLIQSQRQRLARRLWSGPLCPRRRAAGPGREKEIRWRADTAGIFPAVIHGHWRYRSRREESTKRDFLRPRLGLLVRQVFPRPAAAHAPWLLSHDVRTGPRVVITRLDQTPAALAGAGQGESPSELAAAQKYGQMARLITDDLGDALIPDDHRVRAARLPGPAPL